MFKRIFDWADKRKKQQDFASVAVPDLQKGKQDIEAPVIALEKYPVIVLKAVSIVEKVADVVAERAGKRAEEVLEDLTVTSLLQYLPIVLEVASAEFFALAAYILEVEEDKVRKLGIRDFVRLATAVLEKNEFAEVEQEIRNFTKTLAKKKSRGK